MADLVADFPKPAFFIDFLPAFLALLLIAILSNPFYIIFAHIEGHQRR